MAGDHTTTKMPSMDGQAADESFWTPERQTAAKSTAIGSAAGWGVTVLTGAKAVGVLGGIAFGAPAVAVGIVAGGVVGLAVYGARRAWSRK